MKILLALLTLLCTLAACQTPAPILASKPDANVSRALEAGEKLLFSTATELVIGTYMESEIEAYPSYLGTLMVTSKRLLFVRWNEAQHAYEPLFWTIYPDMTQLKMENNLLLPFLAFNAKDGTKFTYLLDSKQMPTAYAELLQQLKQHHRIALPIPPNSP
jgi:hypothetical protein